MLVRRNIIASSLIALVSLFPSAGCVPRQVRIAYPTSPIGTVVDTIHGVAVPDPYRWLEDDSSAQVRQWDDAQNATTRAVLDRLPQRQRLLRRLNELERYDDQGTPMQVLNGERIFYFERKKEWERPAFFTKADDTAAPALLFDPNQWGDTTLAGTYPSNDGRYLAFGRAAAGDESPYVRVMEVDTKTILSDTLLGWRQRSVSWLPDNSGFYYCAYPRKGTVPDGEEYYWQSVYLHMLGTPVDKDRTVFSHPTVKEYYHYVYVSENGRWAVYHRGKYNKNEIYLRRLDDSDSLIPVATGFDAQYGTDLLGDTLLIQTDKDAPRGMVYVTTADKPGREHWRVLIPQDRDKLTNVSSIDGRLYAMYLHDAHTVVKVFDLDGHFLRAIPLPGIGSGYVWGYWKKPPVWVYYTSFNIPGATYRYDFTADRLTLYHQPPISVDPSRSTVEQVWFTSRDGTRVPMFLFYPRTIKRNGRTAVLLTGYGGFNLSETPHFSPYFQCWLEVGGMVAVPNLRGGGEYGKEWHEAGMRDRKQNVFDDFIAAAQWLIDNNYTTSKRLVLDGASNGGLLTGAMTAQRPDLFHAAYVGVPLLDMVRYHKFGYANVWAEEYGSAEDPAQFEYLLKYSPYHNVTDGVKYPAVLLDASENDVRVHPLHARKMAARLQQADAGGGPILYLLRRKSGHGGGTRLTEHISQKADVLSFLMDQAGLMN